MKEWLLTNINATVIVAVLGTLQVFMTMRMTRESRRLRNESSKEHLAIQSRNEQAIAKVVDKIDENTVISSNAVVQAAKAYEEANNMNVKIANLQEVVSKVPSAIEAVAISAPSAPSAPKPKPKV